jgi:DNA-binding NarL/FixJ family response regulator
VRAALGEKAFDAKRDEGRRLCLDQVLDLALKGRFEPATKTRDGRGPQETSWLPLTRREQQIAELIAEGLSSRVIAAKLVISQRTAHGHVEHIQTKLGFSSRARVAAWVTDHRAPVPPPERGAGDGPGQARPSR